MRSWCKWMISHRLSWLLIIIIVLLTPVIVIKELPSMLSEVCREVASTITEVRYLTKQEKEKKR